MLVKRLFRRISIQIKLSQALKTGELTLVYQPIAELETGRVVGFEALIRWPGSGLRPDEFLPIAKMARLMPAINEFVIHQVAEQIQYLPEPLWISFNMGESVVHIIDRAIKKYGIDPSRLWIELVEHAHLDDAIVAELAACREVGHPVELDDWGTNQSNPLRLLRLPCDGIKVDIAFIKGVSNSHHKQIICEASLRAAEKFGFATVIAEGVEAEADRLCLIQMGYKLAQGYHPMLGKPVSGDELPRN